jgi:hypothetical protein
MDFFYSTNWITEKKKLWMERWTYILVTFFTSPCNLFWDLNFFILIIIIILPNETCDYLKWPNISHTHTHTPYIRKRCFSKRFLKNTSWEQPFVRVRICQKEIKTHKFKSEVLSERVNCQKWEKIVEITKFLHLVCNQKYIEGWLKICS